MSRQIIVKAIKRNTWSGFGRFNNTKDYITPLLDASGTYVTGLSEKDEKELGTKLKKDLTATSDFWHEYKIIMTDRDKILFIDTPEGELAHKFILAHKRVANSETEKYNWPYADYIIYNEENEAKIKNEKFSIKRKAVTEFNKLSVAQMRDILKLYPGFTRLDSVTADVVEARLFEKMEEDSIKFLEFVGDKKLDMKVLLKDLVASKVLRKNKSAYYYGTDNIGHDEESTITYLEDPQNQGLLVALKKELNKG